VLKTFSILIEDFFGYSKVIRKQYALCVSTHIMNNVTELWLRNHEWKNNKTYAFPPYEGREI